jgi:hypothetical protein
VPADSRGDGERFCADRAGMTGFGWRRKYE